MLGDDKYEIEMEYDMLKSKVKDVDAYSYFSKVVYKLYATNEEAMETIIGQLSAEQKKFMQGLLQTRQVTVEENGEKKVLVRKVVKARRRRRGGS